MDLTATYSPEDNKLRLYASTRLDAETYAQVKAAGFSWAPRQQLFVAPMWTPQREDLLLKLCGEIGDEDKSLAQRASERAERFENYSENRAKDAEQAHKQVTSILEHIPFGQPILVGHHSEKRARKDVERIDNGMRKSVRMWDTSKYWAGRAEAAILDAKYKEQPDVRARRIKKLEAEERKKQRTKAESERLVTAWSKSGLTMEDAAKIASRDHGTFLSARQRTDGKTWPVSLWDATQGRYEPQPKVEEIVTKAVKNHQVTIAWADRWLGHFSNRLTYERTMLKQDGGIVADQKKPEIGGACQCWASPRGGWSIIQKVNKVSVTLLDNWGNGGEDFRRTIPFDKLRAVMTKVEVDEARQTGRLLGEQRLGFILAPEPSQAEALAEGRQAGPEQAAVSAAPVIRSGIETPRGPLTRKAPSQEDLFKPQVRQSPRQGIGL
ncbi:MAG: hypothetical protein BGO12_10760 [Verrucomicrobia bacterium 61-8]|nr:DUF3560 domain-containing protein [Verrucomicrobiota bacterium]OJV11722.1 MAG: hypothetical protein BGO12_10760 [Verrucomicrobia bacterium 61-8]